MNKKEEKKNLINWMENSYLDTQRKRKNWYIKKKQKKKIRLRDYILCEI
jgi:hypothetical protein